MLWMRRLAILTTLTALAIGSAAVTTHDAEAHFRLEVPAVMTEQNDLGDPQKTYACGGGADAALTGDITAYTAGDTITITIDETVYHPGHYRVALATGDVSELPPDAAVTPMGGDDCAMAEIMDPPVYPILADGMLPHDSGFDGPQSFEVTLPDDVSCDNCTLQVVQYMSSHGAPCFYYHCANISIAPAQGGETTGDPGGSTTGDPTGEPGTTTGEPDPTGASGSTTTGERPQPGGTEDPPGTSTATPTGTDGMGQDDSEGSSGCVVGGSGTAAWLVLIPLFAFSRRRDRRARAS